MMRDDELFAYAKELRAPSVALEALKTAPVVPPLWTVDLARRKGTIDPATAKALRELLSEGKE